MITVPEEFTPTINTIYPWENDIIFEDWVSHQIMTHSTERHYLPIQWTAYHVNNQYGNNPVARKNLQDFVNSLPRDLKYWTICQYDDGVMTDFGDLDILVFSMSKKVGIEIPLLCKPHSYVWKGKKTIHASFIGTHTHPIREKVFGIKNKDYYISDKEHSIKDFCDIISHSLFGLCPRGYGLNSFRIAECMQYETIPVYISDEFINCFDIKFNDFGILIPENEAHNIEKILMNYSNLKIVDMQIKIEEIYKEYYTYEGAFDKIKKILNADSGNS
jgi:hypothetical protein